MHMHTAIDYEYYYSVVLYEPLVVCINEGIRIHNNTS